MGEQGGFDSLLFIYFGASLMKRSLLVFSILMAVGCENHAETSVPQSFSSGYHKVLGPDSDSETVTLQLFAVLQRYAYTAEGGNLAPHFTRAYDEIDGVESYAIRSSDETIKCDKITSLAGVVYMCEFALKKAGLDHQRDERSIPAILYKALENVRGTSPKAIMDGRNTIACVEVPSYGYGCELDLPDASDKGVGTGRPGLPPSDPVADPHEIPVFR